jgi:hypothetical protein
MKLDASGTRSTDIEYGQAPNKVLLSMQVAENGEVKMTDILANGSALQNKLD